MRASEAVCGHKATVPAWLGAAELVFPPVPAPAPAAAAAPARAPAYAAEAKRYLHQKKSFLLYNLQF